MRKVLATGIDALVVKAYRDKTSFTGRKQKCVPIYITLVEME
ncbi:hypothetical protein [Alteribacillus persepolensis]|nr:hypothetical protein [Alteribacillus persepolensis]